MKKSKKYLEDLLRRFETTCGWCGRRVPTDMPVFGGGGKARPGINVNAHAGQVLRVYLEGQRKTVLVAVTGRGSEARRAGEDFVYMTCSEACAHSLKTAIESDIEMAKGKRLP